MKHFSVFLFLVLLGGLRPTLTRAQTPDSLSQKLTSIFANVDKSQVPTGYLYEAGVRFLEPRYYNGTLADSNLTDMNVLRYLRAQLSSCRVYGSDTLPSLPAFNGRLRAAVAAANGAIPIAMQYLPYASIRPDALRNNLLTVQNQQVYDVAGRSQSPYQTNVLFAAAPEMAYSRTGTVSFLFRRNLYLSDSRLSPTIALDFGDGNGYQPVNWDQAISTTYATAGTKRIKVKITFSSVNCSITEGCVVRRETLESWFDFQVLNAGAAARYGDNGRTTYYHVRPPGNPYGATVTVVYGKNHGQHVVKPFIVAEQYNIAGAAPHLVKCNNANNTVDLFLDKIGNTTLLSGSTFNETLESAGYDLVYIDFEQNLDDITRNAQVFQYVVQQVNAWKSTSQLQFGLPVEQNVVMGLSMGGLIARYGLAAMTKNNFPFGPPDTRLLVLHDSPQRGAYNPLGVQSLTRSTDVPLNTFSLRQSTLADMTDQLADAVNVLNQPATQQLAILNAFNGRGDIRANTFIDGPYRDMTDFTLPSNASGPQPAYQIVATSDGSQCGHVSGALLGVQLTSIDTRTTTAGAVIGTLISLLTPVPVLSRFSLGVRAAAYGLPAYGRQAIISQMRVYVEYRIGIGVGPFGIYIPIRYNLLNESATSPPNTLPYETLPGGTTNLARESGDCGNQKFPISLFLQTSLYNGDICFVPTYSAFDVPVMAPATAYAKYINNMTDNPSTPRVSPYIAQANPNSSSTEYNLNHLTFNARNSEWIFDQMQHLPLASNYCSNECLPLTINSTLPAGQRLCAGNSITLSIPGLAPGTAVAWSATPGNFFTVTTGSGPTFTTAATSAAGGSGTITATVGPCNNTVSISVPVGAGEPTGRYVVGGFFSGSGTPLRTVNPAGPDKVNIIVDAPYNFTFTTDPYVPVTILGSRQASFYMPANGSSVNFTATATNATADCGVVGHWLFIPSPYHMVVAPNPASTELTVARTEDDPSSPAAASPTARSQATASDNGPDFDADLYDNYGRKVKSKRSDRGRAVLDVRDLPNGLYVVRVGQGKEAMSQHVQITH